MTQVQDAQLSSCKVEHDKHEDLEPPKLAEWLGGTDETGECAVTSRDQQCHARRRRRRGGLTRSDRSVAARQLRVWIHQCRGKEGSGENVHSSVVAGPWKCIGVGGCGGCGGGPLLVIGTCTGTWGGFDPGGVRLGAGPVGGGAWAEVDWET